MTADSARLGYRLRTLLSGSVVFDRLFLYSPDVTIERLPGQEDWNYDRIFSSDSAPADTSTSRTLILIQDATVADGRVTIRMPWEPEGPVTPEDTARLILEAVPGGLARTYRFEAVSARVPRIVWEAPEQEGKVIDVAGLSARAFIWETPAHVQDVEATVAIHDSLITFDAPVARLPASRMSVVGRIVLGSDGAENAYDIAVDGEDVALADLRWLYPPIPEDGGGRLRFRLQTQASGSMLWLARDARIRTGATELAGSFGVVTGDTLYFTNVDLQASPLDLELIRQLVPAELPIEGLLIGTIEVDGPISALGTRGDMRLRTLARNEEPVESRLRWDGTVGFAPPYVMRGLTAELDAVELGQVALLVPQLRLRGSATGRVEASGSLHRGVDVAGEVALDGAAGISAVRGSGRFAVGGERSAFDLRLDAEPVGLDLLSEQFPSLGRLEGNAVGTVTVAGPLTDLGVAVDLVTPAGAVLLDGRFGLAGPRTRYRVGGALTDVRLHRVAPDLPEALVSGRFDVEGSGRTADDLDGRLAVDLQGSRFAGVGIHGGRVRASVAAGRVRLDTLSLSTQVGELDAGGTFGLAADGTGTLAVRVAADSLAYLEPLLGAPARTTLFDDPEFIVQAPGLTASPGARLAGRVTAEGRLSGWIGDWTGTGRVRASGVRYGELELARGEAEVAWSRPELLVDGTVDSVGYGARRIPHGRATLSWRGDAGEVVARIQGPGPQQLAVGGGFQRLGEALDLRLGQLELATRDGRWTVADTVRGRLSHQGLAVDSLVLLRSPRRSRIRLAGTIPWLQPDDTVALPAALELELDSVDLGELSRVAQNDSTIGGVLTGRFSVTGSALAPRIRGRLDARPFRYSEAVLDSMQAELDYAGQVARARFEGWNDGGVILSGDGTVPLDLSLAPRDRRRLDRPMRLGFRADRLPAPLVSFLAPGFSQLEGALDGELAIVGTTLEPALEGELRLTDGAAFFAPLNVRYERLSATARMGRASIMEVDASVGTGEGGARVRGKLDLSEPSDPLFSLDITANGLRASGRRDVTAVATGRAQLRGRFTRPIVSVSVTISRGEMNLDEIWRQNQIVRLDPSLFLLFDSTAVAFEPPDDIPFLDNMLLTGVTVTTDRDFWLRSRELNVEVSGSLGVEIDRQIDDLRLTGTLAAVDGSYALELVQGLPVRVFEIRQGTVEFVGTPGIDPNLEIAAGYRVRRAQGDPLDVVAEVTGTLQDPRVTLTSDSDLPVGQSDLASYILFGRSGAELTQAESDVLSVGGLGYAIGFARPVVTGLVSTELQRALAGTGLPIDYVALTTPEYGYQYWRDYGLLGMLQNTQLEVGVDVFRNVSVVGSVRYATDGTPLGAGLSSGRITGGARVELRPWPTWTVEGFLEDRFARTPSFGFSEVDDRKVLGLSLFRDWGY
ncbi:MAG: translocation/assembly module TamB domain-containing protein [Gemmatimonadota bacterium]